MPVLVLGATGFIGQAVALRLLEDGHAVIGLGRDITSARLRCPAITWVRQDLATMATASDWLTLITGVSAVINCAGALQDGLRDDLTAVQLSAMRALYAAAAQSALPPLIVQISAPAALATAGTAFIDTKLAADRALAESGLPHVILRPTLVIGRNAYGGTALLRALAALPGLIALTDATSTVSAVHIDDMAQAVADAVNGVIPSKSDRVLAGSPSRSLEEMVRLHRTWLGLPPATVIRLPTTVATIVSGFADLAGRLGWRSPLRSTATAISRIGIAGHPHADLLPDPIARLMTTPAGVQDLWFARLYLLKPVMIVTLALFWIASGAIPLFRLRDTASLFAGTVTEPVALAVTMLTCLLDIALGVAVLLQPFAKRAMLAMLVVSLAYLASATLLRPILWVDPLGPLIKVVPSMMLTLVGLAVLKER